MHSSVSLTHLAVGCHGMLTVVWDQCIISPQRKNKHFTVLAVTAMELYQGIIFHLTKVLSSIIIIAFELKMSALITMVIVFFLPSIEVSKVSPLQPNRKDISSQKKRAACFMKQFI